jgi:hypothetical protein
MGKAQHSNTPLPQYSKQQNGPEAFASGPFDDTE